MLVSPNRSVFYKKQSVVGAPVDISDQSSVELISLMVE